MGRKGNYYVFARESRKKLCHSARENPGLKGKGSEGKKPQLWEETSKPNWERNSQAREKNLKKKAERKELSEEMKLARKEGRSAVGRETHSKNL